MKYKDCIKSTYEENGIYTVEVDMIKLVQKCRGKEIPSIEDVQFAIKDELELERPYKIIFVEGELNER